MFADYPDDFFIVVFPTISVDFYGYPLDNFPQFSDLIKRVGFLCLLIYLPLKSMLLLREGSKRIRMEAYYSFNGNFVQNPFS